MYSWAVKSFFTILIIALVGVYGMLGIQYLGAFPVLAEDTTTAADAGTTTPTDTTTSTDSTGSTGTDTSVSSDLFTYSDTNPPPTTSDTTLTETATDPAVVADGAYAVTDPVIMDIVYGQVTPPGAFPNDTAVGGIVFESTDFSSVNFSASATVNGNTNDPSAAMTFDTANWNGVLFYKNCTFDSSQVGPFNISISTSTPELLISQGLLIHATEIYCKQVNEPASVFPSDYWTTQPEIDIPLRLDNQGVAAFSGTQSKMNIHKFEAQKVTIPNFLLKVEPGHKDSYVY
ncbi:MAG: hypothetical protein ACM3PP_08655 [Candidatus Saccharibacteria bacterium]